VYFLHDRSVQRGTLFVDHLNPQTQERLIKGNHEGSARRAAPRATRRAAARGATPRGRAYAPILREIAP
jgi:hypothetical protein